MSLSVDMAVGIPCSKYMLLKLNFLIPSRVNIPSVIIIKICHTVVGWIEKNQNKLNKTKAYENNFQVKGISKFL